VKLITEDSLISEGKGGKKKPNAKAITHHLPQADRCPANLFTMAALEDTSPSLPPFPPSFTAEHDVVWYGTPLYPVWVNCPGCLSSHSFAYLHWAGRERQNGKQIKP